MRDDSMPAPARLLKGMLPLPCAVVLVSLAVGDEKGDGPGIDPAAWGSDHVGKPWPDYVTGDECLFCHRDIGPTWNENRHQATVRPASPDDPAVAKLSDVPGGDRLVEDLRFLMGSRRITRFLRRSQEYGQLELLSSMFVHNPGGSGANGALLQTAGPHWDTQTFGERCAGCHSTAVDTRSRAFAALSLDCFVCHGDVSLEHTGDISRVLLSGANRQPRMVVSICGQCHLRGGKSRNSGLPYPDTFVAGDNLFRDYQVDFAEEAIRAHPAADQHIWLNVRAVALLGDSTMDCLSCHQVHAASTERHQQFQNAAICASCHLPETDNTRLRPDLVPSARLRTHSRVCDY